MKDDKRIPVFYCLLKGKSNKVYEEMFDIINGENDRMSNKKILMGDFEVTKFKFLKKFGDIQIKACYFHYSQIMYRKSKTLKHCSSGLILGLKSLALSPENRTLEMFELLKEKYGEKYVGREKDSNIKMIKFFDKNYYSKHTEWNVSTLKNRTNNFCESLNRDFQRFLDREHIRNYLENIDLLGKIVCKYIEERIEMDKSRKPRRDRKYEKKDELINILNEIYPRFDSELLLEILGIISRNSYSENMQKQIWALNRVIVKKFDDTEKDILNFYDKLTGYYHLLKEEHNKKNKKIDKNVSEEVKVIILDDEDSYEDVKVLISDGESSYESDDESSYESDDESSYESQGKEEQTTIEKRPKLMSKDE